MESETRLKKPEKEIIAELQEGDRTKGFLVEATGRHRNTIYRGLERLEAAGIVECLHRPTHLYSIKNVPEDSQ
ncbi:helix-turn-helix domain-containing protein [Halosimplex aquaticum]|uniref:Helix-turn-helix domain-containing protein n=1 Tax=Halosimplex aquaticum TaxID=3026162 RepID=A0ABD5Y3A7_9EURY|nr:helix-turn-helix domain-containing protein [Halosimplex aquaticum]